MGQLAAPEFGDVPSRPLAGAAAASAQARRGLKEREVSITPMGSRRGIRQPEDAHSRLTRRPYLLDGDLLLVKNVDDVTWRFRWDHRNYDIRPGQTLPVPFPAVANMMGDPRSAPGEVVVYHAETGERGAVPSRYEQLVSLFAHYGIADESIDDLVAFAPKIEVQTMSGETVVFPAQNPEMAAWPVPQVAEPGREQPIDQKEAIASIQAENQAMRSELDRMRRLVDVQLGGVDEPADEVRDVAVALGGAAEDGGPRTRI